MEATADLLTTLTRLAAVLERQAAPAPAPELTDLSGVAMMLGIAERTARRLDVEGRLPCSVQVGKSKRWRIAELREWILAGAPGRQKWESMRAGV